MRSFIRLKNRRTRRLPEQFRDEELRYPDELVALFLRDYTRPGDTVLDPFAGYGTTLIVAEALGRRAVGVEYDARRVGYIRDQLAAPDAIVHGDSRRLAAYDLPPCDFCMTSPPFMERGDADDPLENYGAPSSGYDAYLSGIGAVFAQVRALMRPGARAVIEVANLRGPQGVTTLAWDVARSVGAVLRFDGEVVVGWDHYAYGYDHSYCLLFTRPETP